MWMPYLLEKAHYLSYHCQGASRDNVSSYLDQWVIHCQNSAPLLVASHNFRWISNFYNWLQIDDLVW